MVETASFAELLRRLRLEAGLSLRKLDLLTGINYGTLSRMETGKVTPNPKQPRGREKLLRIARALEPFLGRDPYGDLASRAALPDTAGLRTINIVATDFRRHK